MRGQRKHRRRLLYHAVCRICKGAALVKRRDWANSLALRNGEPIVRVACVDCGPDAGDVPGYTYSHPRIREVGIGLAELLPER